MRHQDRRSTVGILCLLFTLTVFFTGTSSDEHGLGDLEPPKMFTKDELGDKLKDLLENRPERPDGPDFDMDFETLFGELDSLASGMPDDFEFDVTLHGPPENHPIRQNARAMQCLNDATQFPQFLRRVHEVLQELKMEYLDDLQDSMDIDDDHLDSKDNDTSSEGDRDQNDSTGDDDLTTDSPDSSQDSDDSTTKTPMQSDDNMSKDMDSDDSVRRKRDMELEGFDLDEVLDRFSDDDVKCLAGFISDGDEKFLCRRFAYRSSGIFAKIMAAGLDCDDILDDDDDNDNDDNDDDDSLGDIIDDSHDIDDSDEGDNDDDDDDDDDDRKRGRKALRRNRLDESHQLAILKGLVEGKESAEWDDDDIKKVLRLAPDVIDDDFVDDLSEELFKMNLHSLGRLAARRGGNPRLRYALRERLDDLDLSTLTPAELQAIGPGLLSLRLDQIEAIDGNTFLDLDVDDLFDDDLIDSMKQDSRERDDDDDDDDDDEDDVKLAIGRRVKEAIRQSGQKLAPQQIRRAMQYLHYDLDFLRSLEPDDLFDALDDIHNIDFEPDEARSILYRLYQSPRFPMTWKMTGYNLTQLGSLLRGMSSFYLANLQREALEEALDSLKDVDFDDGVGNNVVLRTLGLLNSDEHEDLDVDGIRRLGKLFRGMPGNNIMEMKDDVIEDALDDLDDFDLEDVQKKMIAEKIRHNNRVSPKLLQLNSFAKVLSVDDIDDFDDDDIKRYMNVSSFFKWRLPQAAVLAQKYKRANGVRRLRPSDLALMGNVAVGLLPDDLEDMIKTPDDVLDLAEELREMQEDLTSGLIDELVDGFNDVSDLDNQEVVIDEPEAMQGAHVLAYLQPEHFDKLDFTRAGKRAFVSQVAKMGSHKMARHQVQFLARKMLDMIEDMDSAEKQDESPEDRESRRLRSLGHMALGLTPSQISGFKGKAIIDNLDILRTLPLTQAQAKAVLEKVEDETENWRCRGDVLARVGPLLQHHDNPFSDDCGFLYQEELLSSFSAVMKGMEKRKEMVKERLEEGFARENDDATDDAGEKRLVDALVLVATQKTNVRKRRATTITSDGSLTCDVLSRLGSSAKHIDLQLLRSMPSEEFKTCLAKIGAISDWSPDALVALMAKMKKVFYAAGLRAWDYQTLMSAGSVIAGLSPAEIQTLTNLTPDILHSIGKHGNLNQEQLKAGFRRWIELSQKSNVSQVTGGEFSSIADFVCGLETSEIGQLLDTTFKRALDVIGRSTKCTPEQRKAYTDKAVMIYGPEVSKWDPPIVADMGHLLGALNGDHIKMLTTRQLSLISPMVIQHLPREGIAAMTPTQLLALSSNQASAVTQDQYNAMTSEQQKSLDSRASIEFEKQDDTSNTGRGNDDGKDGAGEVAYSLVLSVAAVLFFLILI